MRDVKTNISHCYRAEQNNFAEKVFIESMKDIAGDKINIDKLKCFHDIHFPERHPVNISYESLIELEKIQSMMMTNCPSWVNREDLNNYMNHNLLRYIYLLCKRGKFTTLFQLLASAKFRKRYYVLSVLFRTIGSKLKRQKSLSYIARGQH